MENGEGMKPYILGELNPNVLGRDVEIMNLMLLNLLKTIFFYFNSFNTSLLTKHLWYNFNDSLEIALSILLPNTQLNLSVLCLTIYVE